MRTCSHQKAYRIFDILLAAYFTGLFISVCYKAYYMPMYLDEINSFFLFIQTGDYVPFKAKINPGNHFLNSFLSHLCYLTGGSDPFTLRIPNILASILYFFFCDRIRRTFQNPMTGFMLLIALSSTVFFVDFFSISRGYGLSLAFLSGAIWQLIVLLRSDVPKYRNYLGLFLFSSLAIWSNLSLLPLIMLISFTGIIRAWLVKTRNRIQFLINIHLLGTVFLIPCVFAVLYSFALKDADALYFGSVGDLYNGLFIRLWVGISGSWQNADVIVISFLILLSVLVILNRIRDRFQSVGAIFFLLLFSYIAALYLMFRWLSIPYPADRTAIQVYWLLLLVLFMETDRIGSRIMRVPAIILTLYAVLDLVLSLPMNYVRTWAYESLPDEVVYYTSRLSQKKPKPIISGQWFVAEAFNFHYFNKKDKLWCNASDSGGRFPDIIVRMRDYPEPDSSLYDHIGTYLPSEISLYQRRNDPIIIFEKFAATVSTETSNEFTEVLNDSLSLSASEGIRLFCSGILQPVSFPRNGWLVTELRDSAQQMLVYRACDLQRLSPVTHESHVFEWNVVLETEYSGAVTLKVYIWNIDKQALEITSVNTSYHLVR